MRRDSVEQSESGNMAGMNRRKIIGWLGLSVAGAMVLKMLPMRKTVSKKLRKKDNEKILVSINNSAVKRKIRGSKNV